MPASAILLVDDDHDTYASLSDILSGPGYRVDVAYDGPAALERSRRRPHGLVLLDDKMPGMGVLPKPVDIGHLIPLIEEVAGAP